MKSRVHVRKHMDRCMMNVDWRLTFSHALVEILSPRNLDHSSLLFSCSKSRSIKSKNVSLSSFLDFPPGL